MFKIFYNLYKIKKVDKQVNYMQRFSLIILFRTENILDLFKN